MPDAHLRRQALRVVEARRRVARPDDGRDGLDARVARAREEHEVVAAHRGQVVEDGACRSTTGKALCASQPVRPSNITRVLRDVLAEVEHPAVVAEVERALEERAVPRDGVGVRQVDRGDRLRAGRDHERVELGAVVELDEVAVVAARRRRDRRGAVLLTET